LEPGDQVVPSDAVLMRPALTMPRAVIAVLDRETATNVLHQSGQLFTIYWERKPGVALGLPGGCAQPIASTLVRSRSHHRIIT
jgi:hypothetical protein